MAKVEKKEKKAPAPKKAPAAKKEKKAKKPKDPNAPKKPLGAYMYFCKDHRAAIKTEHPDWGLGDIGRELGSQWKELDDKAKVKYTKLADADKERYKKDMVSYKPPSEDEEEPEEEAASEEASD